MCKIVGYVNRRTLLNEHRVIVYRSYTESGKSNRRMAGSNGRKYLTNRDKHRCTETSHFARDDQAFLSVTTISVHKGTFNRSLVPPLIYDNLRSA